MKELIRAIIVDDEPKAQRILHSLCEHYCEGLEIVGLASSAAEAKELIINQKPDLVFLDIEMPNQNGFSLLDALGYPRAFEVVFTTAYDSYALQGLQYHAIDYLLKPIDIDELVQAVQNVIRKKNGEQIEHSIKNRIPFINKLALSTTDGFTFVNYDDIVRCEAEGNYTKVVLRNGEYHLITKTLKHYEDILTSKSFFRVHKSHLINLKYVRRFLRGKRCLVEMTDNELIEVSARKKDVLLKKMSV